ncbi:MAG: ThiF family adenylyltransferase [Bryobacteraceae bacterium]|jgi:molybdopterin/thiamine biosynthesis adenylyltransferase|nr:ThiF family adenylyltransferase [Solibacteraceae bacterium]MCO5349939.1 ThiF family adenylyltransferase [Bryobacteraceae bacterium]
MNGELDITILDPHWQQLRSLLEVGQGHEASAYLKLGVSVIAADPWTRLPRTRLVSHSFLEVAEPDRISSSPLHVTWSTRGYMRLLSEAMNVDLMPAIVHTHPGGSAFFSEQDDANEAELARTARLKGTRGLASIVLGGDGSVAARIWLPSGEIAVAQSIRSVGGRVQSWSSGKPADDAPHLDRQARLFGDSFNAQVRALRVAVVGCGGTGSAAALLLARLGIGHILLIDKDTLDETNLNRVHGSRRNDATSPTNKVDISEREILAAGLGTRVAKVVGWAGEPELRDGLKSCDFIFGCTDDHSGRLLLNRLAYFYGIPVIDVGLRMRPVAGGHDIFGRVTTLVPEHPCLLCGKVINARRAGEESLERSDPDEFHKRKQEAYVMGAGDPAPAVVTFTTEMACVAVDELIAALTGFHGKDGMIPNRARRFHARDDRFLAVAQLPGCPLCSQEHYWGRGDIQPFLDVIG